MFPFGFFYNLMIIFRCKSPWGISSLLTPPQYLLISLLNSEQIASLRPEPKTGYRVSLGLNNTAGFSLCLSSICGRKWRTGSIVTSETWRRDRPWSQDPGKSRRNRGKEQSLPSGEATHPGRGAVRRAPRGSLYFLSLQL